jgi:hypothetical protein
MKKKVLLSALLVLAIVAVCFAADITGHWTGRVNDQFDVAYDFKVDGTTLTGTHKGPDGNVVQIKNGVIKGDSLSFTLPIMDNEVPVKGVVKGDVMSLSMTFNGNPVAFELKKDAAK